jgi:transposase InsO family protein
MRIRFTVIGPLLSAPPPSGQLRLEIEALSKKSWRHPTTGQPMRFGPSTIERWYYKARSSEKDPIQALRRRVRKDCGQRRSFNDRLVGVLLSQYKTHGYWSYRLHADNLKALVETSPELGPLPSYPTVVRFMKSRGLFKTRRPRNADRPGVERARAALESREVRSFEATHVGGLWHLDFHKGSLPVLGPKGTWITPIVLGVLDDFSRLCCHAQWYTSETAEDLIHGLSQALQKRGLPRALLTDNGGAMVAEETTSGLLRLSITHETTLPYSPHQNGKQECFWGTLEGRLMAMLREKRDLTLDFLNQATQAWGEIEYNRAIHSETGQRPIDRFLNGPDVSRECPSSEELRLLFRAEVRRTQRRSDGTISLEGIRFEIPSRFRHLQRLFVRYARFNMSVVHIVDHLTGVLLSPIYPIDKQRNSDGQRRSLAPVTITPGDTVETASADAPWKEKDGIPPLLEKLLSEYAATGAPPGYLPKRQEPLSDPDTSDPTGKHNDNRHPDEPSEDFPS